MPLHLTTDNIGSIQEATIWNDKFTKAEVTAKDDAILSLIRGGVPANGDTLKKLYDKIANIELVVGDGNDADSIVNTLNELIAVFKNYPENTLLVDLLNGKVNVTDIVNTLDTTVSGKVLDARQGKALKDLIDSLNTAKLGKTEAAADSIRLGGFSASYYASNASVDTKVYDLQSLIRGGVDTSGDTLKKLNDKIVAIEGVVGSGQINANNITSGTLSDGRLSSNVALKNASNIFTQPQTVTRAALSDVAYATRLTTDTFNRLAILADGSIMFGGGGATPTMKLYRASSAMISTTNDFGVEGSLHVNGELLLKGTVVKDNLSGTLFSTSSTGVATNRTLDVANTTYSLINIKGGRLNAPILQEGGVDLSAKYLNINGKAADSNRLNGQLASFYATNTSVDIKDQAVITQLRDNVATDGDTLKKLYNKIAGIQAIMNDGVEDADNIVNTVSELLAVFQNFPENVNILDLLNSKVNTSDVINTLDTIVGGKVLDARQGKALKDLLDALSASKLGKTETAADSLKLGGQSPAFYATNAQITALKDGVPDPGDTLNKLYTKIVELQNVMGNGTPNKNGVVETVSELLEIFKTYPEGVDIFSQLGGKIGFGDVANTLDVIASGKVLDARQGKVLKDFIDALETNKLGRGDIAANSNLLGGQIPDYYRNADNINAGTLSDLRLSDNVAFLNGTKKFTEAQTIERTDITDSALKLQITNDIFPRLVQRADGRLIWGNGSASGQTFMYRYADGWIATNSGGGFRTTDLRASYLTNLSTADNGRIFLNDTGIVMETNIAGNVGLKVSNTLLGATANLLELANNGGRVAYVDINGNGVFASLKEGDTLLTDKYLGLNATADNSAMLGGQLPAYYASDESVTSRDTAVVNLLRDTVPLDGDTLKKLNDKIIALQTLTGDPNPDADAIVNTLSELLAVFNTYPEDKNIYDFINSKIDILNIANNLVTTTTGKVLDARQGKVLADDIATKLNKADGIAYDSYRLGAQLPAFYQNATNINDGKLHDDRLNTTVALTSRINKFDFRQRFVGSLAGDIVIDVGVTGGAFYAFQQLANGTMFWGDRGTPLDTKMYRDGIGLLKTDGTFVANKIGIGTNAPSGPLHVMSADTTIYAETSGNRSEVLYKNPSQTWRMGLNTDNGTTGNFILGNVTGGNTNVLTVNKTTNNVLVNGAADILAKFGVIGSGATTATTNFLLRNSSGTDLFKVNDGGEVWVGVNQLVTTLGKIPDGRLNDNVALLNRANTFTQTQRVERGSDVSDAFTTLVTNDAKVRLAIRANGHFLWSDGTAGGSWDTTLYRQGVGVLKTDSEFQSGTINTGGIWATSLNNKSTANNASVQPTATGTVIETALASNIGLRVRNITTTPTGDLIQASTGSAHTVVFKVTTTGAVNAVGGYSFNGQSLDERYLGKSEKAADSNMLNGQLAAFYATDQSVTERDNGVISLLRNGVVADGDTLFKIFERVKTIEAIIGESAGDNDNIVNTVNELLKVFETYPEGTDIMALINDRVKYGDITNNLLTLNTTEKTVLDARQGKVLKDLIDGLETNKLDKANGIAYDSYRLGSELPSYYLNATNINAGTLDNNRLSGTVALWGRGNVFSENQTIRGTVAGNRTLRMGTTGDASDSFTVDTQGTLRWLTPTNGTVEASLSRLNATTMQWTTKLNVVNGLQEGGVDLSAKYLGLTAKAADSDKLNGQLGSFYTNAANLTGNLSDARLSTNIPRLNATTNNFTGVTQNGGFYHNVLSYDNSATPAHGVKIKTNIPRQNASGMHTVIFEGYNYGDAKTFQATLTFYQYTGSAAIDFSSVSMSVSGSFVPNVKLAYENEKVIIFLDERKYYMRFGVRVFAQGAGSNSSYYSGWTSADEAITAEALNIRSVTASNEFNTVVGQTLRLVGNSSFGDPVTSTNRVYIKGQGITSSTNALRVDNVNGTELIRAVDSGQIYFNGQLAFSSGKLDDGRLSDFVALTNKANTFTLSQRILTPTVGADAFLVSVINDTVWRFRVGGDGRIDWGDGSSARDASLYRSGVNALAVDGDFSINKNSATLTIGDLTQTFGDAAKIRLRSIYSTTTSVAEIGFSHFGTNTYIKHGRTDAGGIALQNSSGTTVLYVHNTTNMVGVGTNTTTPQARLHIKGTGATSTTTALKVDNSSDVELFKITNDGAATIKGLAVVTTDDPRLSDTRTPTNGSVGRPQMDSSFLTDISGVPPSEAAKILEPNNWDNITGEYIGPPIINTEQGQRLKDRRYRYEADEDNLWIRLMRA
jgi:hypothetical protein